MVFQLLLDTGPPLARRGNALSRRTLRDGSLGDPFPGTSCQATIVKSLRETVATLKMSKLQTPHMRHTHAGCEIHPSQALSMVRFLG